MNGGKLFSKLITELGGGWGQKRRGGRVGTGQEKIPEKKKEVGGGFFAIWPADSGPDCGAGKRRHKRNRRSPLNPGGGAVNLEQGNTGALIYLLQHFIRTPLTAAGALSY